MVLSFFFSDQLRPVTSIAVYVARCIAATALLLSCLGCMTVIRGTTQYVEFISDPPGATVELAGMQGVTPCKLLLDRSWNPSMFRARKEGLETIEQEIIPLEVSVSREGYLLPVAFVSGLMILPGIIDLTSGCLADWPYQITAKLPQKGTGTATVAISRDKPGTKPKTSASKRKEQDESGWMP